MKAHDFALKVTGTDRVLGEVRQTGEDNKEEMMTSEGGTLLPKPFL